MDKKDLKFAYKNTLRPMGVYQIKNNANGKVLIGSSLNLEGRKNRFDFERMNGSISADREMKADWAQYGPENFTFEVLEELKPVDDPQHDYKFELAELERKWIEKLQPFNDRGYNRKKK